MTTDWSQISTNEALRSALIISTDEQKFNLDGLDERRSYWNGLRKNPTSFSRRNFGGRSFMAWNDFSAGNRLEIAFVSGSMDSMEFQDSLHRQRLSFVRDIVDRSAPSCKLTPGCMPASQPKVGFRRAGERHGLPQGQPGPELNGELIEHPSTKGLCNYRQFQTIDELKTTIIDAWEDVESDFLKNVMNSMLKRLFYVLSKLNS
ncbi:hypothetical protein ANCCAN_04064 [Ancylostoma caninum]|uniref:Uncharacterized protein n=1 Tax=Ancylostoma caninum TaxID=29170 RepID=A0A368GZM1_ANCCA|nr:hypothetical protein ANCCAN_04064 [Ancylostoma caninum]